MAKPDYFGVGPRIGCPIFVAGFAAIGLGIWKPEFFTVSYPYELIVEIFGYVLLGFGIVWNATSVRRMATAVREGVLLTDGTFRLCRNPIYAGWVFFIIPALAMVTGFWLLWFLSPALYFRTWALIHKEEQVLEQAFGQQWADYRARTNMTLPSVL